MSIWCWNGNEKNKKKKRERERNVYVEISMGFIFFLSQSRMRKKNSKWNTEWILTKSTSFFNIYDKIHIKTSNIESDGHSNSARLFEHLKTSNKKNTIERQRKNEQSNRIHLGNALRRDCTWNFGIVGVSVVANDK